ncbi:DNA-binding transcriptional regulator, FadR family [Cellulosimicrobium aquatile]|uniref:FadR family transcriptional regulator n=2 Tax=Cellulosimicrobium TaxID=157920 RepID=A0A4Y8R4V4_9MICO|nr:MULTISPECIES: GntR family transcriptional regulator [Cellulosimicrobium]QUC00593.1 FadR family transcriptional regulator [Cellulosimicrobium cellulans]TFF16517.1 FadR family transcriptional regulator [Cellulosimicrobium funkei]TGA78653.1 FadR family transcriptional regulator [Cellulosimicrobium terreum]SIQ27021.1 DNA-binding transcriptional regulator, FadR family [Cellulosimicrobium aquatile]
MRRVGLIDQAAARFRDEIVSGRWAVGERIPTEAALVAEFGVGRNTVREALQSLVHAGLLRREQGRGTFVISSSELTGTLERQLAGGSRRHYLELRLALDSTAASLAAASRSDDDVEHLRELRDRREAAWEADDRDARARADLDLHRAIVAATHNPLYVTLYSSMLDVFTVHMRDEENADDEAAHRHHHELVEAVARQDAAGAAAAVAAIFDPFLPLADAGPSPIR